MTEKELIKIPASCEYNYQRGIDHAGLIVDFLVTSKTVMTVQLNSGANVLKSFQFSGFELP